MSQRLRGNEGLYLTLNTDTTGAGTPSDVAEDVKKWAIDSEDKDDSDLTFAEAASGLGKDYTLTLTGLSSFASGSLWRFLWDNPGAEILAVVGPKGNAAPSAEKPHFWFTAKVNGKPQLSNEARVTIVGADFEHPLAGTSDLHMDDGSGTDPVPTGAGA